MNTTCPLQRFRYVYPTLVGYATTFLSALLKAHNKSAHSKFLQQCLEEQVIPSSLLPVRLGNLRDIPFGERQGVVLRHHLKATRTETRECFKQLAFRLRRFQQWITTAWKQILMHFCYGKLRNDSEQLKIRLRRKLAALIDNSDWTKHANRNFTINLSSKVLSHSTSTALGYGINFALNTKIDPVQVAGSFARLEKNSNISVQDLNICRGLVYGAMHLPHVSSCPKRFLKAYKELKKDRSLHITKADKSNALVILDKTDYISKIGNMLSDATTYAKLNKDPGDSVVSNFNKTIKSVLSGHPDLIKQFITLAPSMPYLYGLIKTHKPGNPVRPIISTVGSATYKLSKWLVSVLGPLVGSISKCHVINNQDLVNKLNTAVLTYDFQLVSFDVTSLFTRVPISELLVFLADELPKYNFPINSDKILALIRLCIVDSKFQFEGKFYKQTFGMQMGNPLSPVLSNIFMEFFENKYLSRIKPPEVVWLRYVDDILCLWPRNQNVDDFLENLNSLVPSIKFTVEVENEGILPFLDVLIHRDDRNLRFSIYRKPTNISSYVHYYSAHTRKVKISVFSSMFLRCLHICSPEFIFNTIYDQYNL